MPSIETHGANIYYEVHGSDGPAIAFAHGRGGNGASWWQQVPHFAGRYRVVVFDHRGFGRSVCEPGGFDPKFFADDLAAVLDDAGIGSASLVCQSMGGVTGMGFALAHPDRTDCLVLACTSGGIVTEALAEWRKSRGSLLEQTGFSAALAPDYGEREPVMAYLYGQIRAFNTGEGPAARARSRGAASENDPAKLAGYTTPTLIVTGETDQLFPPPLLHEVATLIPGCEVADLPVVGHSAYFEDAPGFNKIVGDFLDRHAGSG
jgi:pimeloyl-ACP methyl ester carboxylesterase